MVGVFHTVPFKGIDKILRNTSHIKVDSKGVEISPPERWMEFTKTKNTLNTPVLGAIALQEFIGVDIDNNEMFDRALSVLSTTTSRPAYIARSMPVHANKGGHILFSYDKTSTEVIDAVIKLTPSLRKARIDVQMGNKLIYLATEANTTKELITEPIKSLDELTPLPSDMVTYFINVADIAGRVGGSTFIRTEYGFLLNEDLSPTIVSRLTPKRDYPNVTEMDDIPKGQATQWMLQVRKKLQTDNTVSPEVFTKTIVYLNSLWSAPRGPSKQLSLDIERDLSSEDFTYNKDWKKSGLSFPNYLLQSINVYYYPQEGMYIQHNSDTDEVDMYPTATLCINSIISTHKNHIKMKGEDIIKKAITVRVVDTPLNAPRLSTPDTTKVPLFNLYTPSEGAGILQGLDRSRDRDKDYSHPSLTLEFLHHLIPEETIRTRFMGFIAYKHRYYEHSPLYFVLAGVGGAGKGVLVDVVLRYLASDSRVISENLQGLMNNFNEHLSTVDYLEIDEAGEGYTKRESQQLVAWLKRVTGSENLTIEGKGVKKQKYRHFITPILSSNINTKLITSTVGDDRRLVLIKSPERLTALIHSDRFKAKFPYILSTRDFVETLKSEMPDFANYLSKQPEISHRDYSDNTNYKTEEYYNYIESTMSYTELLVQAAEERDLQAFIDGLVEASVSDADMDSMFALSITGKPARCLLSWTQATKDMGITSLQEVCESSQVLESNVKSIFKAIKERRSVKYSKVQATVQCLEFKDPYTLRVIPIEQEADLETTEL